MQATITKCMNTGIARTVMLCLLSGLYTNFALAQETVTDVNGNVYQTVIINGKVWTQSNYRVTKYADGTNIPSGLSNASWAADTDGACAASPTGAASIYGLLYNGYAVRDTIHGGMAVPAGWRIATDEDWRELEAYLGMAPADLTISDWRGASASVGQKLKSIANWQAGTAGTIGIDEVGFKALPAGIRLANGTYSYASQRAVYWTPSEGTETNPNNTYRRVITYNRVDIHRTNLNKHEGESIRLVKIPKETVTDIDGNVYQTVVINGKAWTQSNYMVTRYADGTCIPSGLSNSEWAADTAGACATPPTGNASVYGLLYNGYAVRNTSHGGIAVPAGWRIATDEDWQALETHLGMAAADLPLSDWRGASASVGRKLKSTTADWQAGTTGTAGTDAVGFMALPAGTRAANGTLSYANQRAVYWTPSEGTNATYRRVITYNRVDIHRTNLDKHEGESIRLVKIEAPPVQLMNYNRKEKIDLKQDNVVSAIVFPNPLEGTSINLVLKGYQGKMLSVRLIGLNGNVVQSWKDILTNNSQTGYFLNLNAKPAAGLYILHLQGNGFSKSLKLIVL